MSINITLTVEDQDSSGTEYTAIISGEPYDDVELDDFLATVQKIKKSLLESEVDVTEVSASFPFDVDEMIAPFSDFDGHFPRGRLLTWEQAKHLRKYGRL